LAALNRRWKDSLRADEDRPAHGFVLVGVHAQGQGTDRRFMVVRPTGEGRHRTWRGETSRHLGVLPALGRGGPGKARESPDIEAAVRCAARAGGQERARRRVRARYAVV
jgi:hypothetical protein